MPITLMKEEILQKIKDVQPIPGRNSMGTSESYYNPYFLISKCFTEEELEAMDEQCLVSLVKLGDFASEIFY